MKFVSNYLMIVLVVLTVSGCSSPSKKIKGMQLGMTPDEVREEMGEPKTIRASKVFDDGQVTEVWEYPPRFLEFNPRTFWIYFENRKVVQWGQPGDFAGKSGLNVPVDEYKPFKKAN